MPILQRDQWFDGAINYERAVPRELGQVKPAPGNIHTKWGCGHAGAKVHVQGGNRRLKGQGHREALSGF
jgi:hypothetical protein